MATLESMLVEEKKRNLIKQEQYKKEIETLPKGCVVVKHIGNNDYYYLKYREGQKTVTKYISKDKDTADDFKKKIEQRKNYEQSLKKLALEYKQICKIIKS